MSDHGALHKTDGETPWTGGLIDRTLGRVMGATLAPAQRKGKTFHSWDTWRVTVTVAQQNKALARLDALLCSRLLALFLAIGSTS